MKARLAMPNGVKQELRTVLLFLVLLSVGFSLFWVATHWIRNKPSTSLGDVVLVSLLVMPLLVYAIASGTLTELKGPGGWGASFSKVAAASIGSTVTHERISPDEDSQILEKGDPEKLEALVRGLDGTKPIAM